jgi:hypothetical protein
MSPKVPIRTLAPFAILVIAFAGLCIYAHPGFMSWDSVVQYQQARTGIYGDAHPPALPALWRILNHVVDGPLGMLVVQTGAFLIGAYLVFLRWMRPIPAALCALALGWFPPVATILAVIWKDSQMLAYLMLGLGLSLGPSRKSRVAGLFAFAAASAMRHNAFTITLALIVLLFRWSETHTRWKRYAISFGVWLGVTAGAMLFNASIVDVHEHGWDLVCIQDIGGIIHDAPPLSDDEVRELLDGTPLIPTSELQAKISAAYSPGSGNLALLSHNIFRQPTEYTDAERDALARSWKRLLHDYPKAYVHERWRTFRELLQLPHRSPGNVWTGFSPYIVDVVKPDPGPVQTALEDAAHWLGSTWLIRTRLYLFALLALTPFAVRARDRLCGALILSAVISESALFFLAPSSDYRYSVWWITVTVLVFVRLVLLRRQQPP